MSSNKKNSITCASVVLVIFLLLCQMSKPVTGKPLLLGPEEENLSNFHSTDPDNYIHLIMEGHQLVKRNPSDEDSSGHVSEALKPLLRLIRIQNLDGDDHAVDYSDPRFRMRYGKRSSADDYSSSFMD